VNAHVFDVSGARRLALSLPAATEQDHHGMPSFRVGTRIFATVPDDRHVRVMAGEPAVLAAVAEYPGVCEPFYWGRRLACVVVDLSAAPPALVKDLLTDAWLRKASPTQARQLEHH
jgi:hypothetical protein